MGPPRFGFEKQSLALGQDEEPVNNKRQLRTWIAYLKKEMPSR
jgi:hypothetical protein